MRRNKITQKNWIRLLDCNVDSVTACDCHAKCRISCNFHLFFGMCSVLFSLLVSCVACMRAKTIRKWFSIVPLRLSPERIRANACEYGMASKTWRGTLSHIFIWCGRFCRYHWCHRSPSSLVECPHCSNGNCCWRMFADGMQPDSIQSSTRTKTIFVGRRARNFSPSTDPPIHCTEQLYCSTLSYSYLARNQTMFRCCDKNLEWISTVCIHRMCYPLERNANHLNIIFNGRLFKVPTLDDGKTMNVIGVNASVFFEANKCKCRFWDNPCGVYLVITGI